MAKDKLVKREVVHPRYYQKVDGKMQHIAIGTEVEVTEAAAKKAGNKLTEVGAAKALKGGQLVDANPGSGDSKLKAQLAQALADNEALKTENAALKKAAK